MFNRDEPTKRVADYFKEIGIPKVRLREIYNLIQYYTQNMKLNLKQLDPW
jgi:hypothetical protein